MSFDSTNPTINNEISDDITNIRTNFSKLESGDVNHTKLSVNKQGSNPSAGTDNMIMFSKLDADSNLELFASDGTNVTQLTRQGSIGTTKSATFTPGLEGVSTAGSITFTTQTGLYTKVNDLVFVNIFIQVATYGGASGSLRITGLPFTVKNSNNAVYYTKGVRHNLSQVSRFTDADNISVTEFDAKFIVNTKKVITSIGTGAISTATNVNISLQGFYFTDE